MTKRTPRRWPRADILVEYLNDFAKKQEGAGRIRYNTTVDAIKRGGGRSDREGKGFTTGTEGFIVAVVRAPQRAPNTPS